MKLLRNMTRSELLNTFANSDIRGIMAKAERGDYDCRIAKAKMLSCCDECAEEKHSCGRKGHNCTGEPGCGRIGHL